MLSLTIFFNENIFSTAKVLFQQRTSYKPFQWYWCDWCYCWLNLCVYEAENTSELRVTNTKWLSGEVSMSSWKQQEDDPPSPNRLCLQLVRVRRHEEQGYKTRRISLRWETPHHKSMPFALLIFFLPPVYTPDGTRSTAGHEEMPHNILPL